MATRSMGNRVDDLESSVGSIEKRMQTILQQIEKISKQQEEVASKLNASLSSEGGDTTGSGGNGRNNGGNHDRNRFLAVKGRKLEIPAFDGTDPDGWILIAERYFSLNRLSPEEQIDVSCIAFEGDALRWFQWENHRRPFRRWEDLKLMILRQFCSSGDRFLTLKQGVTMERVITKRNLQEKGENIERGKEEDIKKRDRGRERVELFNNHFEPLLPLSPPSPPSSPLSRLSPPYTVYGAPVIVVSSTVDQNKFHKENGEHEGSDENKKINRSSKPVHKPKPKPNLAISIRPMPVPNLTRSIICYGRVWLRVDHRKLPRYHHRRSLSSSLKPSRTIHEFIPTSKKIKTVGELSPLLPLVIGEIELREIHQRGDVHVDSVVGFINPRMMKVQEINKQRMMIKDSGATDFLPTAMEQKMAEFGRLTNKKSQVLEIFLFELDLWHVCMSFNSRIYVEVAEKKSQNLLDFSKFVEFLKSRLGILGMQMVQPEGLWLGNVLEKPLPPRLPPPPSTVINVTRLHRNFYFFPP